MKKFLICTSIKPNKIKSTKWIPNILTGSVRIFNILLIPICTLKIIVIKKFLENVRFSRFFQIVNTLMFAKNCININYTFLFLFWKIHFLSRCFPSFLIRCGVRYVWILVQEETQITMPPNNELSMRAVIRDNGNLLYNVVGSATRVTMLLLLFVDGTSAICLTLFRLPLLLRFTSFRPILDIKLASHSGKINVMTGFHAS